MGNGVAITLPDGSKKQFDGPISGMEVAESIGAGLAKAALAVIVDGEQWDLLRTIETDTSIAIITRDSEEGLELLRHDCAHRLRVSFAGSTEKTTQGYKTRYKG